MMEKNLNDKELSKVNGGQDSEIRKDLYENIILNSGFVGASAEDHNVMLTSVGPGSISHAICKYCHMKYPIARIGMHEARCPKNPGVKFK